MYIAGSEYYFHSPKVLWFERLAADLQADLIAGNAVLAAHARRGDAAKAMQWLHDMETQPVMGGPWSLEMNRTG